MSDSKKQANEKMTRNQHYVPQCLLKHFGWKANKGIWKINVFDVARSKVRYNQAVKEVFSQNYFYDKDNSIENFIDTKIEFPASIIIDKIVSGNFEMVNEDPLTLLRFISSLLSRTVEAREELLSFFNSHIESIVRQLLGLNGFDPEEASNGRFEIYDLSQVASFSTIQGSVNAIIFRDLDFHFVVNETELEFYISDHSVFTYNWLYRNLEHPAITSIAARGFQAFLPLSPTLTLCLYDPKVYKYGQKNLVTYISNVIDINILNSFQMMNVNSIIGFHARENENNLRYLYDQNKHISIRTFESKFVNITESLNSQKEESIKSRHLVFAKQTKLRHMPSFVKIKRKSNVYASSFQERDPELVEKVQMIFKQQINKMIKI
ncbi:DUF4238 domain-containing protein [Pseudanabaena sp. FACHB-1277]|uniref:DUF4238 domain-containing protein n=1 Tax=Pseudanabaena cinerea FACHB-1277 TaxID=2949581 RepID=A0A926UUN3_9CYAN|nr:DUF4238 domain-containing protein [Pseudanabaena cinerea]MBD2151487.1 DUF4238 domain-containing protein [Pseudanabaena cinerea FACHB-1277]